jgi:hypothetical protein
VVAIWSFAGDSVRENSCIFSVFPVSYAFNFEGLGYMGKFQIFIEFRGYPDSPGFISAMVGLIPGCIITEGYLN